MMAQKQRNQKPDKHVPASSAEQLTTELAALRRVTEGLQRWLCGQTASDHEPSLYTVIENGKPLPAVNEVELKPWRRAPANVLLDLTRYELWLASPEDTEARKVALGSGSSNRTKLGGPALDFLQLLAERPGLRLTPVVTGELTGRVIDPNNAKQIKRRLCARLELGQGEMICTEESVSSSLPGGGPVYYGDPAWHWRVIRYADWLSPKNAPRVTPRAAA